MTAGWTGSDLHAGDVAWHAWYRLGVEPFSVALGDDPLPASLEALDEAAGPELDRLTREVLDELDVRLYGEARERVVDHVRREAVAQVLWAVVEGVRRELMRPEPEPYVPPAGGSWIRERWRRDSEWHGRWHSFTGDMELAPRRLGYAINDRYGRTRCGLRLTLRSDIQDAAIAEERPSVDACRRCGRAA